MFMISLEVISAYENKFVKVKSSRYAVETAIGLSKEDRTETWEKMVNPYREIIDRYNEIGLIFIN